MERDPLEWGVHETRLTLRGRTREGPGGDRSTARAALVTLGVPNSDP
jgi:hypothetical protein